MPDTSDGRGRVFRARRRLTVLGALRTFMYTFVTLVMAVALVAGVLSISSSTVAGAFLTLIGVGGVAFFGAWPVLRAGELSARRPVIELDDDGVRLPAPWPRARSHDRHLPWSDVAAVCVLTQRTANFRGSGHERLAFLPTTGRAEQAESSTDPELLALRREGLPGAPTLHWSVPIWIDLRAPVERIVAEVRKRHNAPITDHRDHRPAPRSQRRVSQFSSRRTP